MSTVVHVVVVSGTSDGGQLALNSVVAVIVDVLSWGGVDALSSVQVDVGRVLLGVLPVQKTVNKSVLFKQWKMYLNLLALLFPTSQEISPSKGVPLTS